MPKSIASSQRNWKHSTIFINDNLDVMRGMNSGHIDLIYLDPPFNSNHNYAAPLGSPAAGAKFKDTWTLNDIDNAWHGYIADKHPALHAVIQSTGEVSGDSMKSYLIYMAIRILEMKRLLKDTGSIYLHCDPYASHYLKLAMDAVFGRNNFRNEIIWYKGYRGTPRKSRWQQEHETIFFYWKNRNSAIWNAPIGEYKDKNMSRYNKIDENGERYALIKRRRTDGTVYYGKSYPKGKLAGDVIEIPVMASTDSERTGYPTQKPIALLKRLIEASSNPGDIVFDPFCGCASTCIAAQDLKRRWVGIDIDEEAGNQIQARMENYLGLYYKGDIRTDLPKRNRRELSDEELELFDEVKHTKYNSLGNRYTLYGQQSGICNGCQQKVDFKFFQVDHITPQSLGGSDHISNLQLLCAPCNISKGNRSMDEFVSRKESELAEQLQRLRDSIR